MSSSVESTHSQRRRFQQALALAFAMSGACTTQLPVVEDAPNAAAGSAEAAAGSGGSHHPSSTGVPATPGAPGMAPTVCTAAHQAELIRGNHAGARAVSVISNGDKLLFLESSGGSADTDSTEIIYQMAPDGSQEQVFYAPSPPQSIGRMLIHEGTLYFITNGRSGWHLYSMPSSGGTPKHINAFGTYESPALAGIDGDYAYVWESDSFAARIDLRDGSRTDLPYTQQTNNFVVLYGHALWYSVIEGSTGRPFGIYRIDLNDPMLSETRVGRQVCTYRWTMTDNGIFCSEMGGLEHILPNTVHDQYDWTTVYADHTSNGSGLSVALTGQDGDSVYFYSIVNTKYDDQAIHRVNVQSMSVDAVGCGRKQMASLAFDSTHLYWIEQRSAAAGADDGIYRVAKR